MAYQGSQFSAYGAMSQQLESGLSSFAPKPVNAKRRMRMSGSSICICLFFPWLLFCFLYADVSFSLHYQMSFLCWAVVALGLLVAFAIGGAAFQKVQDSRPNWLLFLFISTALAATVGPFLGDINYWSNMQPYYELQTLNEYQDVNPATSQGRQMMDAGKVSFANGVGLDLAKAFQFQDLDTYCVAPISSGNSSLKSYDFWAVGLNCCKRNANAQQTVDFTCGQYKSKSAMQGLRLMDANQRDYFKLAVQQAEAQFKISANQPLFFYWTEDANTDMKSYWDDGFKYFQFGVGASFMVQVFLILAATILFAKFEF